MTWTEKAAALKAETHDALSLLWSGIVKGQKKQLIKKEELRRLLERYEVEYEQD